MDPAAGGPRDRRGGVEAEGGDDAGDVEAKGGGGGAARWIWRPAARATGEAAWRRRAEVAARHDGLGGRRPARPARRRGGGEGAGDVEGGGGGAARWIRRPAAQRDRRGGVEAEDGDGAGDVEAAAQRDGGNGGSAARWKGGRRDRDGMGMQPGWMRVASRVQWCIGLIGPPGPIGPQFGFLG
uniref:Uncharacterized protein K0122H06.42 n=1 Tax=Oryza sativa subsp. indica TaxID=39946 RepID=C8TFF2_ORYSI|nr:hypothetical protein [Oryza sativa Indica Group]